MIRRQGVGPGHRAHAVCGLPGKKPNSLICREMLENELEKIRRLDVAYDNKKAGISLRCIALPICNDEGLIIAGLSISAQTDRHSPGWIAQIRGTASAISHVLGYRQPLTSG